MSLKPFKNPLKIVNKKNSGILLLLSIFSLFGVGFSSWILVNENENSMSFNVDGTVGDVIDLTGLATLDTSNVTITDFGYSGFIKNGAFSTLGYVALPVTINPKEGENYTLYPSLSYTWSGIKDETAVAFRKNVRRCLFDTTLDYETSALYGTFSSSLSTQYSAAFSFNYSFNSSSLGTSFYIIFELGPFCESLYERLSDSTLSFSFSLSIGVDTNA